MPDYHDPAPRARAAIVALAAYMVAQAAQIIAALTGNAGDVASLIDVAVFVTMMAALIAVSCWVYRVNANAHSFANGLAITPGWNVGWFFVPVANLWKPFEGLRETWQASFDPSDWPAVPVPMLLRLWWGCWLIGNLLANVALQVARASRTDPFTTTTPLDLIASGVLVAAAGLLIRIVQQLSRRQPRARMEQAFL